MKPKTLVRLLPFLIVICAIGLLNRMAPAPSRQAPPKRSGPHGGAWQHAGKPFVKSAHFGKLKNMTSYTVSGAGSAGFNGTYTDSGDTYNGAPVYVLDDAHIIYWNGGQWYISDSEGGAPYYDNNGTATVSSDLSTLTWKALYGTAPPPTVTLYVPAPDFSLSAVLSIPPTLPGGSGFSGGLITATITVAPTNGFDGDVALSLVDPPNGITGTFDPSPTSDTSMLTLNVSAAADDYTITVQGVSGSLTHTCEFSLIVHSNASAPPTGAPYAASLISYSDVAPLAIANPAWSRCPALSDDDADTVKSAPVKGTLYVLYGVNALTPPNSLVVDFAPGMESAVTVRLWGSRNGVDWDRIDDYTLQAWGDEANSWTQSISGYTLWQFAAWAADKATDFVSVSEVALKSAEGDVLPNKLAIYPARNVVNALFAQSNVRGVQISPARNIVNALFTQSVDNGAAVNDPINIVNTLFTQSAERGPLKTTINIVNTLFTNSALGGDVGQRTIPIAIENGFLSNEVAVGPTARAARNIENGFLTNEVTVGATIRAAVEIVNTLFAQSCVGTGIVTAAADGVDVRDPFAVLQSALNYALTLKGSPMSAATVMLAVLDRVGASYRVNELTQMANLLATLPELIRGGDGSDGHTGYGFGADKPILSLLPAAETTNAKAAPNALLTGIYSGFMSSVASTCSQLGYASLDAYLTALNAGTRFGYMVSPNAALIQWLYNRQQPSLLMTPGNVFAPQTIFGTAAVGDTAGEVTYTDAASIPTANVTTGTGSQGYTPAPGCTAVVTTDIGDTLALTLTGDGMDSSGVAFTGHTWTATLDSATAGTSIDFTPAVDGDRISAVTAIAGDGDATTGAFYVQSTLERVIS